MLGMGSSRFANRPSFRIFIEGLISRTRKETPVGAPSYPFRVGVYKANALRIWGAPPAAAWGLNSNPVAGLQCTGFPVPFVPGIVVKQTVVSGGA
jgi:hypothetical protein